MKQIEHPAVSAWHELRPERLEPARLEVLKGENPTTSVYRLVWVEQAEPTVIAKRCRQSTALIERTIYEEVLPNLPFPMLDYYGSVKEPVGEFWWLFLEDVSGERYRSSIKEHRIAAARWLGIMNTSALNIAAAAHLPERGPEYYLNLLRSACDTILSSLANPALDAEDLTLLETIVVHCEHLADNWSHIESVCEGMPQTLVHGDFIKKNVAIRSSRDGIILLPYDWEKAGWGVPAEDLSSIDISTYWSTVREFWPGVGIQSFERLAKAGKVFRWLVFLDWIAPSFSHEFVEQPMNDIRAFESWLLADLIRAAQWHD